jgi:predicted transcriptional regulator
MKSASEKSLVNGRSKVRVASDVSLSTTPICGNASKRAVEENQSSVTDERSRCWGKAAAPNEVIFLSTSTSSPSSIVKFDVTHIYQSKKKLRQTFERRRVAAVGC